MFETLKLVENVQVGFQRGKTYARQHSPQFTDPSRSPLSGIRRHPRIAAAEYASQLLKTRPQIWLSGLSVCLHLLRETGDEVIRNPLVQLFEIEPLDVPFE